MPTVATRETVLLTPCPLGAEDPCQRPCEGVSTVQRTGGVEGASRDWFRGSRQGSRRGHSDRGSASRTARPAPPAVQRPWCPWVRHNPVPAVPGKRRRRQLYAAGYRHCRGPGHHRARRNPWQHPACRRWSCVSRPRESPRANPSQQARQTWRRRIECWRCRVRRQPVADFAMGESAC